MEKIKKIKGGYDLFVTEDEKLLVTYNGRNVYVYDLEVLKLKMQVKTISNISNTAISPDKKLLAVKNTSGCIVIISMETGEEIFRNSMAGWEGYQMTFTSDSKTVLDFDWVGRTMLLDCETTKYKILDGYPECDRLGREQLIISHMQYDHNSNQIYKFVKDKFDCLEGRIMVSPANPSNIVYKVIQEFPYDNLGVSLMGISLCKTHNYFIDRKKKKLVMTDKQFLELKRFSFPRQVKLKRFLVKVWVSPCEKYIFVNMVRKYNSNFLKGRYPDKISYLFKMDTMELVQEFNYKYVSDFTMIDEDNRFILSTWEGTYIGEV